MKNKIILVLALVGALTSPLTAAFAQGTAFTYQGRLNDGANLANGSYDLRFALFDAITVGTQQGSLTTNSATAVSNGLFTVTLDFGNQFAGASRWLEIGVRTNGAGNFFTLTPRQPLTPAPYAITAGNVIAGGLTSGSYGNAVSFNNASNSFSGSFSGNGANVTNVNAATLGGLSATSFWKTSGNGDTTPGANFLGTTDNQPLEIRTGNQRSLRIEPNTNGAPPNMIGGSSINFVATGVYGATIAGGGTTNFGFANSVAAAFGTIGGGNNNSIQTNSNESTIAGGAGNEIMTNSSDSTIGGGSFNSISAIYATIPGGFNNLAYGKYSFAAGTHAQALHQGAFVWADSVSATFVSTANDQFLIRATGGVGIGTAAPETALHIAGANGITLGQSANSGGYTALRLDLSAVKNGYAELQAISQGGSSYGNLILQANGGRVGIAKNDPATALDVNGTVSATSFNTTSDRNLKEHFAPVSPREVLDKVAGLPISRWNFIRDPAALHVGPMAQDFHAAFGLGTDDKHIATVDEGGVALAAIQGLNQKLNEKDAEFKQLKEKADKVDSLEKQLNELKQMVQLLTEQK
jgi:trimeric autotransporter adhesin